MEALGGTLRKSRPPREGVWGKREVEWGGWKAWKHQVTLKVKDDAQASPTFSLCLGFGWPWPEWTLLWVPACRPPSPTSDSVANVIFLPLRRPASSASIQPFSFLSLIRWPDLANEKEIIFKSSSTSNSVPYLWLPLFVTDLPFRCSWSWVPRAAPVDGPALLQEVHLQFCWLTAYPLSEGSEDSYVAGPGPL